jgi:DNA modification methylase
VTVTIHHGDCLDVMRAMAGGSVDSVVTDPPYGLGFMGKAWDTPGSFVERKPDRSVRFDKVGGNHNPTCSADAARTRAVEGRKFQAFCDDWAAEALRVLKPGGHLVAFGGTRTYHRMACAIEDAGFEIRDQLGWVYGSGFPKSQNVGKAFDKAAGAEREIIETGKPVKRMIPGADQDATGSWIKDNGRVFVPSVTAPATDLARQWDGWGTALKPAWEPICLARKQLIGTVAANVAAHGTGALNIDGCRVGFADDADKAAAFPCGRLTSHGAGSLAGPGAAQDADRSEFATVRPAGRWPANLCHDGSDEVLEAFARFGSDKGAAAPVRGDEPSAVCDGIYQQRVRVPGAFHADTGTAARFFYSAKATKAERAGSKHPTVKPIALMRWLVRLITPPGGTVLDPFAGSGTTGVAADREGFNAILIEREAEYMADIRRRIHGDAPLFAGAA